MRELDRVPFDALKHIAGDIEKYTRMLGAQDNRKDIMKFAGEVREVHRFITEFNIITSRMERLFRR